MIRTISLYGLGLAGVAMVLAWLEMRASSRLIDPGLYGVAIALVFTALGIWLGRSLTRRPASSFVRNDAVIASLGLSPRELEVLALLAAGQANKEMARALSISPNTVKTHLASLFTKLEAQRRTEAVKNARALGILP